MQYSSVILFLFFFLYSTSTFFFFERHRKFFLKFPQFQMMFTVGAVYLVSCSCHWPLVMFPTRSSVSFSLGTTEMGVHLLWCLASFVTHTARYWIVIMDFHVPWSAFILSEPFFTQITAKGLDITVNIHLPLGFFIKVEPSEHSKKKNVGGVCSIWCLYQELYDA